MIYIQKLKEYIKVILNDSKNGLLININNDFCFSYLNNKKNYMGKEKTINSKYSHTSFILFINH